MEILKHVREHTGFSADASFTLKYRDLLQVMGDVGGHYPSVEVRRNAVLIHLPPIRAVVLTDKVLLLPPSEDSLRDAVLAGLQNLEAGLDGAGGESRRATAMCRRRGNTEGGGTSIQGSSRFHRLTDLNHQQQSPSAGSMPQESPLVSPLLGTSQDPPQPSEGVGSFERTSSTSPAPFASSPLPVATTSATSLAGGEREKERDKLPPEPSPLSKGRLQPWHLLKITKKMKNFSQSSAGTAVTHAAAAGATGAGAVASGQGAKPSPPNASPPPQFLRSGSRTGTTGPGAFVPLLSKPASTSPDAAVPPPLTHAQSQPSTVTVVAAALCVGSAKRNPRAKSRPPQQQPHPQLTRGGSMSVHPGGTRELTQLKAEASPRNSISRYAQSVEEHELEMFLGGLDEKGKEERSIGAIDCPPDWTGAMQGSGEGEKGIRRSNTETRSVTTGYMTMTGLSGREFQLGGGLPVGLEGDAEGEGEGGAYDQNLEQYVQELRLPSQFFPVRTFVARCRRVCFQKAARPRGTTAFELRVLEAALVEVCAALKSVLEPITLSAEETVRRLASPLEGPSSGKGGSSGGFASTHNFKVVHWLRNKLNSAGHRVKSVCKPLRSLMADEERLEGLHRVIKEAGGRRSVLSEGGSEAPSDPCSSARRERERFRERKTGASSFFGGKSVHIPPSSSNLDLTAGVGASPSDYGGDSEEEGGVFKMSNRQRREARHHGGLGVNTDTEGIMTGGPGHFRGGGGDRSAKYEAPAQSRVSNRKRGTNRDASILFHTPSASASASCTTRSAGGRGGPERPSSRPRNSACSSSVRKGTGGGGEKEKAEGLALTGGIPMTPGRRSVAEGLGAAAGALDAGEGEGGGGEKERGDGAMELPLVGVGVHEGSVGDSSEWSDETEFSVEDTQILLECYVQEIENMMHTVSRLDEELDDVIQLMSLSLASVRNVVLKWDLGFTIVTGVVGFGSFIAGSFGMNIATGLENMMPLFWTVFIAMLVACVFVSFCIFRTLERRYQL
uniref:Magnesium transporter n=1 Tax=Chromera velia CCMP2878 TaxID=1169474 RepID=A0A0G4FQA0_9ALVE|eukprot:Cvel_18238.t1-p1 / transcript=Cvel_18238.t1 / gene=Cvel_18238 / organism=Chromera_velia_CCMP2878 / gene_product=Magnesium transporter MRS2-C, putative / transcript_product=Magnesium transporter MRS2-C, putative / location=Cvel_scaffold1499:37272-44956(-) / protein_length=1009 / sequence_SO=supercontig / SO=protein_coding / is_pseudo=false